MDDNTLLELIPAYAMGALEADERTAVEGLLARSAQARQMADEYQQMLDGLALLAPARHAPAHLTDDFAQRLKAEADHIPPPKLVERLAIPPVPPRVMLFRAVGLVAAVLIVIMGAALAYRAIRQQNEQNTIAAIVKDPASRQTVLQFNDPASTARVVFYSTPGGPDAVLEVQDLPALPADRQYELWLIDGPIPKASNVFSAEPGKSLRLLIPAKEQAASYQVVALTIEPAGGGPTPTTKPIAAGQVTE